MASARAYDLANMTGPHDHGADNRARWPAPAPPVARQVEGRARIAHHEVLSGEPTAPATRPVVGSMMGMNLSSLALHSTRSRPFVGAGCCPGAQDEDIKPDEGRTEGEETNPREPDKIARLFKSHFGPSCWWVMDVRRQGAATATGSAACRPMPGVARYRRPRIRPARRARWLRPCAARCRLHWRGPAVLG
jgi:hypothetical protein